MKNNLNTFKVLHIVRGCLLAFCSVFIWIYIAFISLIFNSNSDFHYEMQTQGDADFPFNPADIIPFLIKISAVLIVLFIGFIVCNFLTARYLNRQKNYYFIFTISILNCFTGLLGLLLGIFTLIEITKPEVKKLFISENAILGNNNDI